MTIKIEVFPAIETDPSDLMDHNKSTDLNLRIMNSITGSSLLCVVMEESADSFLVALPCKMMAYGERKVIEPYMSVPFIRLFKPTLPAVIPMFGEFEHNYLKWLLENGNNLFPNYIGEEAIKVFQKRYDTILNRTQEIKTSLEGIAEKKEDTSAQVAIMSPINNTKH